MVTIGYAIAEVYAQYGFIVDLVDKNPRTLEYVKNLTNSNLVLWEWVLLLRN